MVNVDTYTIPYQATLCGVLPMKIVTKTYVVAAFLKFSPPPFPLSLSGVLLAFLRQRGEAVPVGVWASGFHVGHRSQQEQHDVCDSGGGGLQWRVGWRI